MVIMTAVSGAGAAFLLYVLYHFRREELRTRAAAMRASRSVIVQEIEPKVPVANCASNLKLFEKGKLLVIRFEVPDGLDRNEPLGDLSSPKLANPQEDELPAGEETDTEEEG